QQLLISFCNIAIYIGTFWALSQAIHFSFNLTHLLLFAPLILIIINLPFFYLGLGGREAILLMLMPVLAPTVGSETILAASLGYGALTMLSALLGGFYLFGLYQKKGRSN